MTQLLRRRRRAFLETESPELLGSRRTDKFNTGAEGTNGTMLNFVLHKTKRATSCPRTDWRVLQKSEGLRSINLSSLLLRGSRAVARETPQGYSTHPTRLLLSALEAPPTYWFTPK